MGASGEVFADVGAEAAEEALDPAEEDVSVVAEQAEQGCAETNTNVSGDDTRSTNNIDAADATYIAEISSWYRKHEQRENWDEDADYKNWLSGEGLTLPFSSNPSTAVGYRHVATCPLLEKVRQFVLGKAWPHPDQARIVLCPVSDESEQRRYVSGHHRGCAVHAMLRFHWETGSPVPAWLQELAASTPITTSEPMSVEDACLRGLTMTLHAQYGAS